MLAAPLLAFNKLLGVIYLESDAPCGPDDVGRLRLLMSIAAVAATALGYERHAEALVTENKRLQSELEIRHQMIGQSSTMQSLYRRVGRVDLQLAPGPDAGLLELAEHRRVAVADADDPAGVPYGHLTYYFEQDGYTGQAAGLSVTSWDVREVAVVAAVVGGTAGSSRSAASIVREAS